MGPNMDAQIGTCPLCGAQATRSEDIVTTGKGVFFDLHGCDCPHCGRFVFDLFLAEKLKGAGDDAAFRIACLLRERALRGEKGVFGLFSEKTEPQENTIHKHLARWWQVDELLAEFPKATEIIDRALINLSRLMTHPMEWMPRPFAELQFLMFCPEFHLPTQVNYMKAMGLLQTDLDAADVIRFTITPQGWQRIDALSKSGPDSKQTFVAMWFDEQTDHFFSEGFVPGLKDAGYKARRIDNKEHNNKICDEIVAEIRKSRFVVADFTAGCCKKCETCEEHMTCRDTVRQRGGVYFEAGFALGLGIPVIWTVRKDQIEHIHFDTRQYSYIVYENAEELRQKLRNRIAATIH